jgi:hypothetical protein
MAVVRLAVALLAGVILAFLVWSTAAAHHSVAGQFDTQKSVNLTGVVSKVDWINPHIYIHLDVKDKSGKVSTWQLECVPIAMARKAGLSKSMLIGKGEPVTAMLHPARDGSRHLGYLIKLTYADGRVYQFSDDRSGATAKP